MADLGEIRARIKDELDREERDREHAYGRSRELIKICRDMISRIVQGEEAYPDDLLSSFDDLMAESVVRMGFVEDALTELSECILLHRSIRDEKLPFPEEIGLTPRTYALGACDAVGELRRIALNRLIDRDIEGAIDIHKRMKDLFSIIDGLTYPSGMIQLKRKQDSARSSIDRTQGELTMSLAGRGDLNQGDR
jgi:translin